MTDFALSLPFFITILKFFTCANTVIISYYLDIDGLLISRPTGTPHAADRTDEERHFRVDEEHPDPNKTLVRTE